MASRGVARQCDPASAQGMLHSDDTDTPVPEQALRPDLRTRRRLDNSSLEIDAALAKRRAVLVRLREEPQPNAARLFAHAQFYPWPAGDGEAVYLLRLLFGSAMVFSIVRAVDAIRRRDFASHGNWMIRGYAIGIGAGTQVLTHLPYLILVGRPSEFPRAVMMGAGWIINVVVAEWVIRRHSGTPAVSAATHPAGISCANGVRVRFTPAPRPALE